MKKIDAIIVNYNSTNETIELIKSFKKYNSVPINFFIVDNNSQEDPKIIKKKFPSVNCIYNKTNMGFSKAINQALKKGNSPYIAILNPDVKILNDFMPEVLKYLDENQSIGVIGPKILDPSGKIQGSARRFPNFWTSLFGRRSTLTRLFPNNPFTKKEFVCFYNNVSCEEVDWVSGACMIMRRRAIEKVNGFDERFFLYWEDTDICNRIKNNGWKVVYYKKGAVTHTVGRSSRTVPIRSIYHFHKSCFLLFNKSKKITDFLLIPIVLFGLGLRCGLIIGINWLKSKRFSVER